MAGARLQVAALRGHQRRGNRDSFSNEENWDGLDGLVHAIAFAPREAIAGDFLDGLSREAFAQAHDISAYSFPALAKAALPMMQGRRAALVTLTYLGAARGAELQHHGPRQGELSA